MQTHYVGTGRIPINLLGLAVNASRPGKASGLRTTIDREEALDVEAFAFVFKSRPRPAAEELGGGIDCS